MKNISYAEFVKKLFEIKEELEKAKTIDSFKEILLNNDIKYIPSGEGNVFESDATSKVLTGNEKHHVRVSQISQYLTKDKLRYKFGVLPYEYESKDPDLEEVTIFPSVLRQLRESRDLSLELFAECLGRTNASYKKLESKQNKVTRYLLNSINKELALTPQEYMFLTQGKLKNDTKNTEENENKQQPKTAPIAPAITSSLLTKDIFDCLFDDELVDALIKVKPYTNIKSKDSLKNACFELLVEHKELFNHLLADHKVPLSAINNDWNIHISYFDSLVESISKSGADLKKIILSVINQEQPPKNNSISEEEPQEKTKSRKRETSLSLVDANFLVDKIRGYIKKKHISKSTFVQLAGISSSSYYRFEKMAETQCQCSANPTVLEKIANLLKLDPEIFYIKSDEESKDKTESLDNNNTQQIETESKTDKQETSELNDQVDNKNSTEQISPTIKKIKLVFLTQDELKTILRYSDDEIKILLDDQDFPKPKVGKGKLARWLAKDIENYLGLDLNSL